ncbi:MAG TPA: alkaline phosphatase PhoX, partial [Vicinamibacterales bacterium]
MHLEAMLMKYPLRPCGSGPQASARSAMESNSNVARNRSRLQRREFLRQVTCLGMGAAFSAPLDAWRARAGAPAPGDDYGLLAPVKDEVTGLPLLQLPNGFRYISFGWTGDALDDGLRTPGAHDGMAAFASRGGRVRLIRNHEVTQGPAAKVPTRTYDPSAGGGTTTLEFDPARGAWLSAHVSLTGTVRNCAGGPTPWGSWLTCEETLEEPRAGQPFTRKHGYVFEVPLEGAPSCEPLVAMGRFVHEAVAVDPATGAIYETEDSRRAGLYRFQPKNRERLADGGSLEMLALAGRPRFDTRTSQPAGATYSITWVPIENPDQGRA